VHDSGGLLGKHAQKVVTPRRTGGKPVALQAVSTGGWRGAEQASQRRRLGASRSHQIVIFVTTATALLT